MRIIETKVYTFDELSEEAKKKAIEGNMNVNISFGDWYDSVYEDAKSVGALIGIKIEKIYFSGFANQGDGACFEGEYSYNKGSVKNLIEYAPKDIALHDIAKNLADIQKKNFYKVGANVKHQGRYSHENCTLIQVWSNNEAMGGANDEAYYGVKVNLKEFMRWIYRSLEKEYDYLTSEEAVKETIEANEYEFLEDGTPQ